MLYAEYFMSIRKVRNDYWEGHPCQLVAMYVACNSVLRQTIIPYIRNKWTNSEQIRASDREEILESYKKVMVATYNYA